MKAICDGDEMEVEREDEREDECILRLVRKADERVSGVTEVDCRHCCSQLATRLLVLAIAAQCGQRRVTVGGS